MEEFEWQESKNIEGKDFEKVNTDSFNDFEEFTSFTQETIIGKGESHEEDFDDFADFIDSSDANETSENFQGDLNNNFDEQISNISNLNKHQADFPITNNQTLIEDLMGVLGNIFRSNDAVSSTNQEESMGDTGLEAILNTSGRLVKTPVNINAATISVLSPQPSRLASKSASLSAPTSRSTTPSSNNNLSSSSHGNLSKINNETSQEIPKQFDVELAKSLCSIPEESLQKHSTSELYSLRSQILSLTRQTSDTLTYWLDQREQTMMDSETYNQMIECLVGHAQKLRDGGGTQGKNSWENRGKNFIKKNSVASGLASLSLSFKNKRSQLSSPRSPKSASSEVTVNNKNASRNSNGMQERPLSM
ncbi:11165_t:CDS:2 [Funneliformis geosporum]|uniref:16083_t:CDS:1 n=1 Tax=Funneliformis geosporum TaxID=1117311 RepID=A0A9W4SDF4_9GLOM|nr:16083_t:CDS:2 [Funneliformis geosporum]CAI2167007.1 11165_t:CDS:2 [Funneliformis geosporum]